MADYLVLRLPSEDWQAVDWVVVDNNGRRKSEVASGTLEEAAEASQELPVIVLVPGSDVVTTTVDLPIRAGAKLRAAIPFALEDHLASDVEDLHFASGKHLDSGLLPVAIVASATLETWLGRLHYVGIFPSRLVADYEGVQRMPNTISMIATGDAIMLNDGAELEFSIEGVQPSDALALAGLLEDTDPLADDEDDTRDNDENAPRHIVAWCDPEEAERFAHDWNALRNDFDSVDVNVMPDGAFPRLAATVAAGAGVNLLQGPYGRRTEIAAVLRPWRIAAGLLLAAFVLGLVGKGVDYVQLARQQAALEEQYIALYQALRPGDTRIPADPIGAADSVLRQVIGNGAAPTQIFLPSLMQLAEAIVANREAEVSAVSYRAGIIDVRLSAPDVATLDKIQKAVAESGRFTASIQDTSQDDAGRTNSRIQIRDAGS